MPRLVKLQRAEKKYYKQLQCNVREAKQKQFYDVSIKQTQHKHTNKKPKFFSETDYYPFKKKQVLSDSIPGPLPSQAYSLPTLGEKFFTGKSLVPDCNTLAYCKGENHDFFSRWYLGS